MAPRIPQRVAGVNVLALPLSTLEGFVFSLVDGRAATNDIAIITGVEASKLDTILDRLSELGAVDLPWAPRKSKPKLAPPAAPPDAHFASGAARYSALEIDDQAAIPRELRKRILDAFYALEGRNHYEALGVPRDADKAAIRASYFEMSKLFHPDSQFGKELGPFRTRMESVFKRLTEAYEVLGKKKKREEYDEYLAVTEQTRRARRAIDRVSREIEAIRIPDEPEPEPAPVMPDSSVLRAPRVPSIASPMISTAPPNVSLPPPNARAATVPEVVPRPSMSNEERRARVRERLRQRLKSTSSRPAPPVPTEPIAPPPAPDQNPTERRRSVIEGLRTSIASSGLATGRSDAGMRAQTHLRKAQDAERAQDFLTASGELQLALACDPDNKAIQKEYERVSKVVARSLATNYEKQAQYEEKTGNWKAAAISWGRVSDNREDDENAARRAAEALLKSSGDLHRAQRYAQKAVQLATNNVQNLTLLGRVYLAAGLKLNAQRELEKAAKLDPRDQIVNNLLRESRS